MVKLLLTGHPSINDLLWHCKDKLVYDKLCADHCSKDTMFLSKSEFNPLTYLKICDCCSPFNTSLVKDDDIIYVHTNSPYTYEQYFDYDKFSNSSWRPDIIIYIYMSPRDNWTSEDYEINMKLDVMYNEPICPYLTYKIDADEIDLYASICDIICSL